MTSSENESNQKIIARISLAAAIIDLIIVLVISQALLMVVNNTFDIQDAIKLRFLSLNIFQYAFYLSIFLSYLFFCEVILASNSFGRLTLGLRTLDKNGRRLSIPKRLKRLGLKLGSIGLSITRPNSLAFYDKPDHVIVLSDLINELHGISEHISKLKIVVKTGFHKGNVLNISTNSNFIKTGEIKIGRDSDWADLILEQDTQVSGKHCILKLQNNRLEICDLGSSGTGSSNGTSVNENKLTPNEWKPIRLNDAIHVADVFLSLKE